MDNPPVNQLSDHFTAEIGEAISGAFQDAEVKAIVLTGTGKNFIAGADLKEMYSRWEREPLRQKVKTAGALLNQIELGPKPVIAAINGNALGGGLEAAMACHYRVASKGAKLGLPEVRVGLIPATGGTQRLPRLIGLADAMEMITTGNPIIAETALPRGLIDEVVEPDNLMPAAVAAAEQFVSGKLSLNNRRTRFRDTRLPGTAELKAVANSAKATVIRKTKGHIAPLKAIEALEKGLSSDIEADIDREIDLFCDCALSDVAKNLIGTFLNTRAAGRLPRI
jgi:enoyl-CoA hydratase/carnithine racemase